MVPSPSRRHATTSVEMYALTCGAEQPLTAEYIHQPTPESSPESFFLPLITPTPPRPQLPPRTNGCGTQIHASAALHSISAWCADTQVSDIVIPLEPCPVPLTVMHGLGLGEHPWRKVCGCATEFVACAVCGNCLGSRRQTPCSLHVDGGCGVFTFLASAVSPVLTAPDNPERPRVPHNYAPDGRRSGNPAVRPGSRARDFDFNEGDDLLAEIQTPRAIQETMITRRQHVAGGAGVNTLNVQLLDDLLRGAQPQLVTGIRERRAQTQPAFLPTPAQRLFDEELQAQRRLRRVGNAGLEEGTTRAG
ncbi:hypothetical protein C8R46DRAFT_1314164 [Mycena filopes]|nr:hypothetical protein C8R46DRAFT_1314156 [Mycena filopes]KAJ7182136.1 hypothetical protein C8R46DRAFT_1314164 [Mycena filopes]